MQMAAEFAGSEKLLAPSDLTTESGKGRPSRYRATVWPSISGRILRGGKRQVNEGRGVGVLWLLVNIALQDQRDRHSGDEEF